MLYVAISIGPTLNPFSSPVDPDNFLIACNQYVPEATLSVGWTTSQFGKVCSTRIVIFYLIICDI